MCLSLWRNVRIEICVRCVASISKQLRLLLSSSEVSLPRGIGRSSRRPRKETPALLSYPVIQVSSPVKLLQLAPRQLTQVIDGTNGTARGSSKSCRQAGGNFNSEGWNRLRRRREEADKITSAGCNVIYRCVYASHKCSRDLKRRVRYWFTEPVIGCAPKYRALYIFSNL